jgi:hypothetical protein
VYLSEYAIHKVGGEAKRLCKEQSNTNRLDIDCMYPSMIEANRVDTMSMLVT